MATWFVIVPEGMKRAASLPRMSAVNSSSCLTVGSAPSTSSPTGASAMAFRICGHGSVTVSLLRSIICFLSEKNVYVLRILRSIEYSGRSCSISMNLELFTSSSSLPPIVGRGFGIVISVRVPSGFSTSSLSPALILFLTSIWVLPSFFSARAFPTNRDSAFERLSPLE